MRYLWLFPLIACVPDPIERPRREDPVAQPSDAQLLGLAITPPKLTLRVGDTATLQVVARYDNSSEQDLTDQVAWSESALMLPVGVGQFRAEAPGEAVLVASWANFTARATISVVATRSLERLSVTPESLSLAPGASAAVEAQAHWSDGTIESVSAIWSTNNPSVATADDGVVTVLGAGEAIVTATYENRSATVSVVGTACSLPASTQIRRNGIMPAVSWDAAYLPDGSRTAFSLRSVYCGESYPEASVIIFVVGAGWCGACTEYSRALNTQAAAIEAAGGILVYVEAQTTSYRPADSTFAYQHLRNIIGTGPGLRVGDADVLPTAEIFYNAPLTTQFPTAFVVRKSDLRIIADQTSSNSMLPYVNIARNPDGDWSNPSAPPFQNNCNSNDEEASEPNDTTAQAAPLGLQSVSGGICAAAPDFYRISHTGPWRLELEFRHALGDLDVYVWDEAQDQRLTQNGQRVGSESYDDNEAFDWSGPALIQVVGYQNASAPYVIRLTAL